MSPHIKKAHERMLATLPRRTHEWRPAIRTHKQGERMQPIEASALKRLLLQAEAAGWERTRMTETYGCHNRTIIKLIGKQK